MKLQLSCVILQAFSAEVTQVAIVKLLEVCRACAGRAQRKSTVHELCTAHSARQRKKKRGSHKPRRTYHIYI